MTHARVLSALAGLGLLLSLMGGGAWPGSARAQVDWAHDAVREAFPEGIDLTRETFFFGPEAVRRIAREGDVPMNSRLYSVFRAQRDGRTVGYATVPTVAVRANPATLLIRISETGTVQEVRILVWRGAPRYRPAPAWLDQFEGVAADDLPRLGSHIEPGGFRQIGARAIVEAVRRFLTIYRLRLAEGGF